MIRGGDSSSSMRLSGEYVKSPLMTGLAYETGLTVEAEVVCGTRTESNSTEMAEIYPSSSRNKDSRPAHRL